MSRLIDADDPKLREKLKFIREGERQIYGRESWCFSAKCEAAIDDAQTVDAVPREIEQANKQAAYVRGYEDGQKDKYGRWGDAIEVVRCHECKRQKVDCPMRYSGIDYPSDNSFCGWGKKKSG